MIEISTAYSFCGAIAQMLQTWTLAGSGVNKTACLSVSKDFSVILNDIPLYEENQAITYDYSTDKGVIQ